MEKYTQERGGFKVGDRVKLVGTKNSKEYPEGAVGTIMEIWATSVPWPFDVRLDNYDYAETNEYHLCNSIEIAKIEE